MIGSTPQHSQLKTIDGIKVEILQLSVVKINSILTLLESHLQKNA